MIEQARAMVRNGDLGEIRIVNLQFAHGFHSAAVEEQNPSTRWRVDPKFAGPSYVLGDVGTHPLYIAKVILPHLKIRRLLCTRQSFVKSRAPLEDNAVTLMEYDNGAVATIWSSAVNAGSMHGQKIRIVGSKASIEWWDERPNQLSYEIQGEPARILERGMDYLYPEARIDDRIGGGHPEGLFEAWANLYRRFGFAINNVRGLAPAGIEDLVFPDIDAGLEGVRWVENCVRSADSGGIWLDYS
jgi:predicted dehydrogenase